MPACFAFDIVKAISAKERELRVSYEARFDGLEAGQAAFLAPFEDKEAAPDPVRKLHRLRRCLPVE